MNFGKLRIMSKGYINQKNNSDLKVQEITREIFNLLSEKIDKLNLGKIQIENDQQLILRTIQGKYIKVRVSRNWDSNQEKAEI